MKVACIQLSGGENYKKNFNQTINYIKKSIKKEDAMPFKIPKGISFVMVDPDKGIVKELDYNKAIFESFKTSNLENLYSGNFLNEKTRLYDNINPEKIYSFY